MDWLIARLKEKTTWIGIIGVAASFGVTLAPEQIESISVAAVAIVGVVLAFTSEKKT